MTVPVRTAVPTTAADPKLLRPATVAESTASTGLGSRALIAALLFNSSKTR